MKTLESTGLARKRARRMLALAYFAGISLIVGWSLPDGIAADRPLAMAKAGSAASAPLPLPSKPATEATRTRGKIDCAGCGVIESVQRIDTPIVVMAGCPAGEGAGFRHLLNVGAPHDPESLASTVASVIADGRGRKKVTVDTRHQIVVRFRDGSKQVFDEATPRSFRVGDRIVVIAGTAAAPAKGLVVTRAALNNDPWRSVRSRTDG